MHRHPHAEDDEDEVDDPEAHDGLFLAPALQLEMVMNGCHLEDPLAEERAHRHLCQYGQRFDVEHEAEQRQDNDEFQHKHIYGQQCAEAERTNITHLESRGLDIEIGVGDECTGGGGVEYGHRAEVVDPAEQGEGAEGGDEHAAGETVHAVGNIHGVGGEHHGEDNERDKPEAKANRAVKGDVDHAPIFAELEVDPPSRRGTREELQ